MLLGMQEVVRRRIGKRLSSLRHEAGLSLRAMAMKANASPGYLSEVERGLRAPTSDFLVRVAHFLNVSPESFLNPND